MESTGFASTSIPSSESLVAEITRLAIVGLVALALAVGAMLVLDGARSSSESARASEAEVAQQAP